MVRMVVGRAIEGIEESASRARLRVDEFEHRAVQELDARSETRPSFGCSNPDAEVAVGVDDAVGDLCRPITGAPRCAGGKW